MQPVQQKSLFSYPECTAHTKNKQSGSCPPVYPGIQGGRPVDIQNPLHQTPKEKREQCRLICPHSNPVRRPFPFQTCQQGKYQHTSHQRIERQFHHMKGIDTMTVIFINNTEQQGDHRHHAISLRQPPRPVSLFLILLRCRQCRSLLSLQSFFLWWWVYLLPGH